MRLLPTWRTEAGRSLAWVQCRLLSRRILRRYWTPYRPVSRLKSGSPEVPAALRHAKFPGKRGRRSVEIPRAVRPNHRTYTGRRPGNMSRLLLLALALLISGMPLRAQQWPRYPGWGVLLPGGLLPR